MVMRSGRGDSPKALLLVGVALLGLLTQWIAVRRSRNERAQVADAGMARHAPGGPARGGEGTSEADAVARALTGGNPANAAILATRYGCGGCHTIPGLPGAEGQVGPPLAGLRHRVFVAGVLPNTADNLINWIVEPRRYSPHSAMPQTGIEPDGARDIAAYLYAH
jgi:cytochrome c